MVNAVDSTIANVNRLHGDRLTNIVLLLSGSLALEALLIGVHCKKRYINILIQYNTIL